MLVYGFTGTQQPSKQGAEFVRETLIKLPEPDLVITGGCIGIDAIVGRWYAEFTDADQLVVLPAKLAKVSLWFNEYPHVRFIHMPEGTDYMDRNDKMAAILAAYKRSAFIRSGMTTVKTFAFTKEQHEVQRSGTWATVRRFRHVGLPPMIHPLP